MKIIQLCQRFYYGGGQERHVLHISKNLVKLGHSVTIVTSEVGISKEFKKNLKLDGVRIKKVIGIPLDEPANQVLFPDLFSYLAHSRADIIHAHGSLCHIAQVGHVAAKYKGIPFVFTPHYHPWTAYENKKVRYVRKYYENAITAPTIRGSSATIAVSDYERDLLPQKHPEIRRDKIRIIPNGVDINFIKNTHCRGEVRKRLGIPEDKKYVLFFGSTTDLRKGIDRALNSFELVAKRVEDAHMVIIGKNTDKSKTIKNHIRKLGLIDRITACGYISDKDKVALLRMGDVLVSPTIYEAFGIVLAEAMYSKIPVIATRCGGVPYVMHHGKHGYLVGSYKSTHAFAKYTIRLLENEDLRNKMGKAGHERVKDKFQWLDISKKIESLYKTVSK